MIAADTNVVLRYLLRDDAAHFAEVQELFEAARAGRTTVLIPSVVLCETAWVLRRGLRRSRAEVVLLLTALVESGGVVAEDPEATRVALAVFAAGQADLADLLIRERSRALGASAVATFDAALLSLDGFVRPRPSGWPDGVAERQRPWRRERRAASGRPQRAGTR